MKNIDERNQITVNRRLQLLLTLLLALAAGSVSSLRNITYNSHTGQFTLELNYFKLTLILLLSWLTVAIHLNRRAGKRGYLKQVLCGTVKPDRIFYLDHMRITATILVITTHTASSIMEQIDSLSPLWIPLQVFSFLCHSSNLLFIMVSGALLLGGKMESTAAFYFGRVSRVAIPMVLYYLCYLILLNGSAALKPSNWENILHDIWNGSPNVPHFWLIYIILFLYLITPLLQRTLKYLSDKTLLALILAFLVFDGLVTYLPLFSAASWEPLRILSWVTPFMAGYFLSRNTNVWYEIAVLAGGLLSLVISIYVILNAAAYQPLIYNTAPTMMLISSSLFLLLKRIWSQRKKLSFVTACISRYSFSILLIHWYILFYIAEDKLHLNSLPSHVAVGIFLTAGTTLALSLLFAILFDNSITLCAVTLFQKLTRINSTVLRKTFHFR